MNRIEDVTNYITECDEEVGESVAVRTWPSAQKP